MRVSDSYHHGVPVGALGCFEENASWHTHCLKVISTDPCNLTHVLSAFIIISAKVDTISCPPWLFLNHLCSRGIVHHILTRGLTGSKPLSTDRGRSVCFRSLFLYHNRDYQQKGLLRLLFVWLSVQVYGSPETLLFSFLSFSDIKQLLNILDCIECFKKCSFVNLKIIYKIYPAVWGTQNVYNSKCMRSMITVF